MNPRWCKWRCPDTHTHQYPTGQSRDDGQHFFFRIQEEPDTFHEWDDLLQTIRESSTWRRNRSRDRVVSHV